MTGAEIIYAVVAVTATLAGFGLGWVAGAA